MLQCIVMLWCIQVPVVQNARVAGNVMTDINAHTLQRRVPEVTFVVSHVLMTKAIDMIEDRAVLCIFRINVVEDSEGMLKSLKFIRGAGIKGLQDTVEQAIEPSTVTLRDVATLHLKSLQDQWSRSPSTITRLQPETYATVAEFLKIQKTLRFNKYRVYLSLPWSTLQGRGRDTDMRTYFKHQRNHHWWHGISNGSGLISTRGEQNVHTAKLIRFIVMVHPWSCA